MGRLSLVFIALASCACSVAMAEENGQDRGNGMSGYGRSLTAISRIFSQLVVFSMPPGFRTSFENARGDQYIREAVLQGEAADQWSQMLTVTGARGLAANPNVDAQKFSVQIAAGFKHACPDTFAAKPFGASKISGQDAFVAVVSCGTVQSGASTHSETALLVTIKGSADYYSIQWAERGPAADQPIDLNDPKWANRLRELNPIRICPVVLGEAAPYPSCLNPH